MKLIDVSHWQGDINFSKVKKAGYDGVIIKAGGSDKGFYQDSKFETNYNNAKNNGLYVGSYYYVGKNCLSVEDGVADAKRFIEIIKGKTFELPVYMDVEAQASGQNDKVSNSIIGFCEEMEKNGYFVGVYASDISGFKDRINLDMIKGEYSLWVARYGSKPKFVTNYDVWQYSSTGKVDGITSNVDLDECYKDFPNIIKNAGLNGFSKTNTSPTLKSNDEIADEVIKGYWGNGEDRKNRLTNAGYNYDDIQTIVNSKLNVKKETATYYQVKKGDNLTKISQKYNTTINKIMGLNPSIADANKIYAGQTIRVK